jgi:hypothetical protein
VTERRDRTGLRLTTRGRVTLFLTSAVFLVLVVVFSSHVQAAAGTSAAEQGQATGIVVVQPGETLWQIAQGIAPDVDPRQTVTAIRGLNALDDGPVVPGQSIVVPMSDGA